MSHVRGRQPPLAAVQELARLREGNAPSVGCQIVAAAFPSLRRRLVVVRACRVLRGRQHATVWATRLDEEVCPASLSTCYVMLCQASEVEKRRAAATHPPRSKPERVATGPNSVWSCVTVLPRSTAGRDFWLSVGLDIDSRAMAGRRVAPQEAPGLVAALIRATVRRPGVARARRMLLADHGVAMGSQPAAAWLEELGVT